MICKLQTVAHSGQIPNFNKTTRRYADGFHAYFPGFHSQKYAEIDGLTADWNFLKAHQFSKSGFGRWFKFLPIILHLQMRRHLSILSILLNHWIKNKSIPEFNRDKQNAQDRSEGETGGHAALPQLRKLTKFYAKMPFLSKFLSVMLVRWLFRSHSTRELFPFRVLFPINRSCCGTHASCYNSQSSPVYMYCMMFRVLYTVRICHWSSYHTCTSTNFVWLLVDRWWWWWYAPGLSEEAMWLLEGDGCMHQDSEKLTFAVGRKADGGS